MDDLRPILERARRAVPDRPGDLDDLSRRRDRRGRSRRVVAAVTALALVAGVGLGGWTVLRDRNGGAVDPASPSVGSEKWPADAWPHTTREEAEAAQAEADAGNPQYLWQTQAGQVAEKYAITVLRWHEHGIFFDREIEDPGDRTAFQVYISSCDTTVEEGCEDVVAPYDKEEALLSMERLVREDRSGVWTITSVAGPIPLSNRAAFFYGRLPIGSADRCPVNPAATPDEDRVREATDDLMAAANGAEGRPETVWKWLDEASTARQGDPDLFAYHFRNTPVGVQYSEWAITYVGPDFPNDLAIETSCGSEARRAVMAVEVVFPIFEDAAPQEGERSSAVLVWITHPDGVRLWYVE